MHKFRLLLIADLYEVSTSVHVCISVIVHVCVICSVFITSSYVYAGLNLTDVK